MLGHRNICGWFRQGSVGADIYQLSVCCREETFLLLGNSLSMCTALVLAELYDGKRVYLSYVCSPANLLGCIYV